MATITHIHPNTILPDMFITCTWYVERGTERIVGGAPYQTLGLIVEQCWSATGDGPTSKPAEIDAKLVSGVALANEVISATAGDDVARQLGLVDGLMIRFTQTSTGLRVVDSDGMTTLNMTIVGTAGPDAVAT